MYQVKTYQCGKTYRAEAVGGALVALCADTPVKAAKSIAKSLERSNRHCIVLAGVSPDRFVIEYIDFLKHNGESIFLHNLAAH